MYPNPASDVLNVQFETNQNRGIVTVKVYSLLGRLVQIKQFDESQNSEISIPLNDFSHGTYLIKLFANGSVYNGKFIKK